MVIRVVRLKSKKQRPIKRQRICTNLVGGPFASKVPSGCEDAPSTVYFSTLVAGVELHVYDLHMMNTLQFVLCTCHGCFSFCSGRLFTFKFLSSRQQKPF